jgi:hypothetical protein
VKFKYSFSEDDIRFFGMVFLLIEVVAIPTFASGSSVDLSKIIPSAL